MESLDAVTRQIQQANDLVDIVSRYVRLTRAGKDFRGLCPFHREKSPSFYVSPSRQFFKCFGCGAGGDVFKFIQLRENIGFVEARRMLADRAGIRLAGPRSPAGPDRAVLARVNAWAAGWFRDQLRGTEAGRAAMEYARRRGLTAATIDEWGLGFAPDSWSALVEAAGSAGIDGAQLAAAGLAHPRTGGNGWYGVFRNRLVFPIRDALDRTVGFGGRTLGDDAAKYLNTAQTALFDKRTVLFGLNKAKQGIAERRCAIIVEGYLDCLMAHQFGFTHTVATLGTALGEAQVEAMRRYVDDVTLLFDSDEAGQRAADRVLPLFLQQRMTVRFAKVPEGKDPCDYLMHAGAAGLKSVLNSGCDALRYKWRQLADRWRADESGPGRLRAIDEFLELIAGAVAVGSIDPIQRGMAINQVAALIGLDRHAVQQRLERLAARPSPGRPTGGEGVTGRVTDASLITDAVGVATQELLGVLLCEPGYYAAVEGHFVPTALPGRWREIAELVLRLCREWGEFTVAEALACVEDPQAAALIVDLVARTEARGNYAAAVEGCLERLRVEREREQISALRRAERTSEPPEPASGLQVEEALEVARRHVHFASPRLRRRAAERPSAFPR